MEKLTARDIMNPHVLAAQADWPLERLAEFFTEHTISGAPVTTEDDRLVGVVSATDIVRYDSLHQREPQAHGPHAYYLHALEDHYAVEEMSAFRLGEPPEVCVRDLMTPAIFNVSEETPIRHVADLMVRGRIHRLFVTREGRVVGIITALDLLKVIRDT
jgi:CBS domain-containing protein